MNGSKTAGGLRTATLLPAGVGEPTRRQSITQSHFSWCINYLGHRLAAPLDLQ